jgi:hypothetical protein
MCHGVVLFVFFLVVELLLLCHFSLDSFRRPVPALTGELENQGLQDQKTGQQDMTREQKV